MTMKMNGQEQKEPKNSNIPQNVRKARQAIKILIARPEFQREVQKLQQKWGFGEGDPNRDGNREHFHVRILLPPRLKGVSASSLQGDKKALENYRVSRAYYADLIELMRKFKLDSQYWVMTLWEYVRTGKFDEEPLTFNLQRLDAVPIVRIETQPATKKKKIIIELGEQTTLKDVKAVWHEVEWWRGRLFPGKRKFKEWKNFDRDSRIYELYLQGKTSSEIMHAAKKEDGDLLDPGHIKKIISTFKKKLGLNDKKKLITSKIRPRVMD